MEDRDRRILEHIGRHRLSYRKVLVPLFFGEGGETACGNVMARLQKAGLVESRREEGHRYYTLTSKGARAVGLPEKGVRPTQGTLHRDRAVLLHTSVAKDANRRRPLSSDDLLKVFPGKQAQHLPQTPHYVELRGDDSCILQVYVPAEDTKTPSVVRAVGRRYETAIADPDLSDWVNTWNYGFVVLAPRARKAEIKDALRAGTIPKEVIVRIYSTEAVTE